MSEKHKPAGAAMDPAIPRLAGDSAPFDDAQGRLRQGGRFHSFSQKICTQCKFFVKKKKVYHAVAGDSAVHRVKRPV
jgi:hypothetical protein